VAWIGYTEPVGTKIVKAFELRINKELPSHQARLEINAKCQAEAMQDKQVAGINRQRRMREAGITHLGGEKQIGRIDRHAGETVDEQAVPLTGAHNESADLQIVHPTPHSLQKFEVTDKTIDQENICM